MYTYETCIPHLFGVTNYVKYYVSMYKRQTRSCIRVEVDFPANLGLKII